MNLANSLILACLAFALIGYGLVQFERDGDVNRTSAVLWIACVLLALALTVAAGWAAA